MNARNAAVMLILLGVMAALARPGALPPAVAATVDLRRVFEESRWRAEAETELQATAQDYQAQVDDRRDRVTVLREDLDLLVPGTEQYKNAELKYKEAAVEYRAYQEFSVAALESLRAASRKRIIERIEAAAADFARANDIVFIFTDDSADDLAEADAQIIQQLRLRRVLYAEPDFDVTDELLEWIN